MSLRLATSKQLNKCNLHLFFPFYLFFVCRNSTFGIENIEMQTAKYKFFVYAYYKRRLQFFKMMIMKEDHKDGLTFREAF